MPAKAGFLVIDAADPAAPIPRLRNPVTHGSVTIRQPGHPVSALTTYELTSTRRARTWIR